MLASRESEILTKRNMKFSIKQISKFFEKYGKRHNMYFGNFSWKSIMRKLLYITVHRKSTVPFEGIILTTGFILISKNC